MGGSMKDPANLSIERYELTNRKAHNAKGKIKRVSRN
jgi:hypothetical protein